MNFHLYQQKLLQIEEQLKKYFTIAVANNRVFTLSQYLKTFCAFVNDFEIIDFFGENIIEENNLSCSLYINSNITLVNFVWNFRVENYIDEDWNMIYLNLIFTDNSENNQLHIPMESANNRRSVSSGEVYKIQDFGENISFDINVESSFQKITSDVQYQAIKDEEPIAMAIYSYSDN